MWNRFYGGRHTDVTVHKNSQEVAPIDESKYMPLQGSPYHLIVPTKASVLMFELTRNLMNKNMPVYLYGG